jgi:DNA-directed RNA polymerase subunit M/transcription elongation factor TFIIS
MRTCADCGRLLCRREAGVDTGRRLFCLECYAEREKRAKQAGDGLLPSDPMYEPIKAENAVQGQMRALNAKGGME